MDDIIFDSFNFINILFLILYMYIYIYIYIYRYVYFYYYYYFKYLTNLVIFSMFFFLISENLVHKVWWIYINFFKKKIQFLIQIFFTWVKKFFGGAYGHDFCISFIMFHLLSWSLSKNHGIDEDFSSKYLKINIFLL